MAVTDIVLHATMLTLLKMITRLVSCTIRRTEIKKIRSLLQDYFIYVPKWSTKVPYNELANLKRLVKITGFCRCYTRIP